jgi:predicted PurR-regulated permease PerM
LRDINTKYLFTEKIKTVDYTSLIKPVTDSLINSSNNIIDNSIQFINSFFNMILIFVISFYLSIEFNKIKKFVYNMADKSNFTDFHLLIREIDVVLSKFIRGQGFVCLVLSVIYSLGLFLVGIKFGILLGIFAGIISFVPYLGSFIGGGLTLILGFSQFGISSQLIFITIIFISGQLFESYFLTPKLVGEAIKLNPIWIIFALMTGAYLSGFVGILISLPIAAIVGVVVRHYFLKLF